MNNRELSNLIGKTFSCPDAIRHDDADNSHVVERFLVPEKIDVPSLIKTITRHYESRGYILPSSVAARMGMLLFQGNNSNKDLLSVTITPIKTMPTSVTVVDLKKTEKNIKAGL